MNRIQIAPTSAFCRDGHQCYTIEPMQDDPTLRVRDNIYVDLFGNILVDSSEQYKNQHTPLESAMNIVTKHFKSFANVQLSSDKTHGVTASSP